MRLCSVNAVGLKDKESGYFYESGNFCSRLNRILGSYMRVLYVYNYEDITRWCEYMNLLFSLREDKIHVFKPPCNVVYYIVVFYETQVSSINIWSIMLKTLFQLITSYYLNSQRVPAYVSSVFPLVLYFHVVVDTTCSFFVEQR